MTIEHTLIDGRWTTREAITSPTSCQSCGYRGATLRPHCDTGQMVCSVCDSSSWPMLTEDTEQHIVDAYFAAREALPAHIVPTDMASWVYRLSNYLRRTRQAYPVTHDSPTARILAVVLAVELGDVCSPELVMRAAVHAGYEILQSDSCTHIGFSVEPAVLLPGARHIEVLEAPAKWSMPSVA